MGLGTAITPSSSAVNIIRSGGDHSATPRNIKSANAVNMRVDSTKQPGKHSKERESNSSDDCIVSEAEGEEQGEAVSANSNRDGNDSIAGSTRRRVPPKNNKKSDEKKK
jgi:hypothetical protein